MQLVKLYDTSQVNRQHPIAYFQRQLNKVQQMLPRNTKLVWVRTDHTKFQIPFGNPKHKDQQINGQWWGLGDRSAVFFSRATVADLNYYSPTVTNPRKRICFSIQSSKQHHEPTT
jgi:hypothetical protein